MSRSRINKCLALISQLEQDKTLDVLSAKEKSKIALLLNTAAKSLSEADILLAKGLTSKNNDNVKLLLWEKKLLDLSLRNNLLNLRLGKNGIKYDTPDISLLEDNLAKGEEFILEGKEITGIYRTMRNNLEETGANTLFLTLGTLRWKEYNDNRFYSSPILMVPVDLAHIGKDKYSLKCRDEEIILNITLREFLLHQFNIRLDVLKTLPKDSHGIDVNLVMHHIRESIKDQIGWEVIEDAILGIFSFNKFVLWNDIHSNNEAIMESDIVRSLAEGRLVIDDNVVPADAKDIDLNEKPWSYILPIDSDSSQMEAVVESGRGRSFVLYGPPGTGKSQTITNMISNAVYHGKRVLFVAQKKAALDVVKNRLDKIGLGPYTIELHSNKVDKNHFLQQLQNRLDVSANINSEDFKQKGEELYLKRIQLIGYTETLHKKQECGLSLYECINGYLSIDSQPMPISQILADKISSGNIDDFKKLILSLNSSEMILGMPANEHPFAGMIPKINTGIGNVSFTSSLKYNEPIEKVIASLPGIVSGVKDQIERNKKIPYIKRTTRQYLERDYKWKKFMSIADINDSLMDDIDALVSVVVRWNENIDKFPQWQRFAEILWNLKDSGLSDAIEQYNLGIPVEKIYNSFMAAYYKTMAEKIINSDPTLKEFTGVKFEILIDKYSALVKEFQDITREELLEKLFRGLAIDVKDIKQGSELTLLRKRIGNKGRGTTIRNIIDQMPNIFGLLCPIMLMSPLSVAQYLDINNPKFDIVIFDEASQMPTCEAIGALARAHSAVIVGDPKQMPPTNFFATVRTDDEEAEIDDLDSILDDCISLSMPEHKLGWHYRSKHESLITFSNINYYNNNLVTFPSSDDKVSHVKWQHVEGYYDYGKTRTNFAEADAITNEIIERLISYPDKSIGVIAFSKQQSDLIEDILAEKISSYPRLVKANNENPEPLFIKNLENVQGDERDIILFSVGYGPDKNGHVSMNFGPLNKIGGEKRLNVAISRARYEMKIFSTLRPEQIDERRTQAEGVIGLKNFLKFAQKGNDILAKTSKNKESQMIRQIAQRLEEEGYEVRTSVGTSDLKIDIAVADPLNPDKYILGVICDGENYYRLKTIRDREVVQPSVLGMLGWNLMHVWSIDWLFNREIVMKNLLSSIKNKISLK